MYYSSVGNSFCLSMPMTMVRLLLVAGSEGPRHEKLGGAPVCTDEGRAFWWPRTRASAADHGQPS